jgi:hypothetical protein
LPPTASATTWARCDNVKGTSVITLHRTTRVRAGVRRSTEAPGFLRCRPTRARWVRRLTRPGPRRQRHHRYCSRYRLSSDRARGRW